jgi:hypothetical protein
MNSARLETFGGCFFTLTQAGKKLERTSKYNASDGLSISSEGEMSFSL